MNGIGLKKEMKARSNTLFQVLSALLVLSFLVCGGLSLVCPMSAPATAEASTQPSHSDHRPGEGGGCPDSLVQSAEQLDEQTLGALRIKEPILLDPDSTALRSNAHAYRSPELCGPPRYTLLSTLRI